MPKSSKAKPTKGAARFEARLERLRSRLNWVIIYVPFDAAERWGMRGQIKVKGEMNGFAFRTCLFPTREGRHFLLVNKRMQKEARAVEGNIARFQMELDKEERIITIPAALKRILGTDRSLRRWYDQLNHSMRSEITKWITGPEGGDARVRRAEQIAERMYAVMDAEKELPPILQIAFARHPRAHDGWDAMSPARRRTLLFAVFYYQTPEARGRRIDKMLDEAEAVAERASNKKTSDKRK